MTAMDRIRVGAVGVHQKTCLLYFGLHWFVTKRRCSGFLWFSFVPFSLVGRQCIPSLPSFSVVKIGASVSHSR